MKEYTPKDVIGMMRTYSDDIKMRDRLKREYEEERNVSSVSAAQYGIESVMPHGNGVSNPTQKAAEQLLLQYGALERVQAKIDFIDERSKRIHKNQHIVTLALRLEGETCQYIANILEVKRTRVQNIINEMAQLMCKNDEEYRLYCAKKNINPIY
ncbi:hypothetical protein FAF33_007045 [Staphylococcus haemolyticus]|uniref:hypothetical protein n=1 Tax=Staphylococcus haemolyticus TaxID=1283 RepID=UPI0010BE9533|nr:hypothetical protein [Staphylococcus haemolyticus]TXD08231.1 hypothetical protein FAF33_007045 [Staphylococcus haemolyticus]